MTEASTSNYWISSTALSITLNAMGDADYIQANVASGAMIMCYMRNIDGLGYDAGHNYRRWNLIANPTYFNSTTEKYVYAAIPRKQQDNGTALIVFPSERVDIYGKSATEVQLGSEDYYYIFLGGAISPSVVGGVLQNRTWTQRVDTGKLASDEAIAAGGDNTWWIYNAVDDTVTFLKAIVRAAFDNIEVKYATVKNLILGGETLTGVANDETPKNSRVDVVTPDYLFGNSDARYVRKDIDDRVSSILTFLNGVRFGEDFEKDLHGAGIYRDEQGSWHIDTDYIHARKKLTAEEVEVMKTSHIKGKVVNSAGGFVISRIEKVDDAWRCCFVQQDSEGRRVYNSMRVDDLALCETFNLVDAGGQLSNHYWHRRVVAVGTDYVDIADNTKAEDYASGSDVPQVGDEVVQLGHLTDKDRQSAIIQSAAGEGSPYFKIIKGINSFTLPKPIFLFDKQNFEIRVENPANRSEYIRLQDFLETMQGRINAVQQQSDKQLVIWFGDVVPTITTEPANEWTDETTKELHEHDIYYNRSYVETGGGRAYSFEKNPDGSYSWHEITDADVLKSLEAAQRAQDTADGKRRVFVREQPVPPYDKGDQWSNATYEGRYQNDLLVCVRPKAKDDPFDIDDWSPSQALTSAQFKSEIKTAADNISATVTNLKNGLVEVGFELDGEKKSFTVTAENFKVQTPEGKVALMTSDGKVNADLIEARSVRTLPGANGLHIDMREGTFDILTADNRKGISMTVDENGFPHLVFFDREGRAKYDLGYTGLKELVSAYRAAYWTRRRLVDVTGRGLAAVWPKTARGREWHEYHAAFHYVTGKLGEHAEEDGRLFELEDFAAPIPDGWYTDENLEGQFLAGGGETVDDGDPNGVPGPRVYGVKIGRTEGGRFTRKGLTVWFRVVDGRASFCDTEGKPLAVGLLQDYPFQPDI